MFPLARRHNSGRQSRPASGLRGVKRTNLLKFPSPLKIPFPLIVVHLHTAGHTRKTQFESVNTKSSVSVPGRGVAGAAVPTFVLPDVRLHSFASQMDELAVKLRLLNTMKSLNVCASVMVEMSVPSFVAQLHTSLMSSGHVTSLQLSCVGGADGGTNGVGRGVGAGGAVGTTTVGDLVGRFVGIRVGFRVKGTGGEVGTGF